MFQTGYTPWNKGKSSWNKGISNTWYSPEGLKAGWKAKKELIKNRLKKECNRIECNNKFEVPKSLNRISYCSQSCAKLGKPSPMRGRSGLKGSLSSNWKGGITSENRLQRNEFRSKMQGLIFKRDAYKCQICESKKDLQVDHIQSWAEFRELRFDPNNCRTLCAKCHYKITFGKEMPREIKNWGHNMKERILP